MTTSTKRTSLPRAAALLIALAVGVAWAQSSFVLAYSTVEAGGTTTAPILADPAIDSTSDSAFGSIYNPAARKDVRAFAAREVASQPVVIKPKAAAPKAPKPKVVVAPSRPSYTGTNHFWIPSLGMSDRVHLFECSRSREPDNYIYRWGCAGTNNVYILGHAYGVMAPLHDLYVSGGLHKGMVAIYADGSGNVHWYKVTSWRVVDPADAGWAIASQPVPSMTLQTCVGKDGQLRLNVRLVQFKVT